MDLRRTITSAGLLLLAGCAAPAPAPTPLAPPTLSLGFPAEVHVRPAGDASWLGLPDVSAGPSRLGPHESWLYLDAAPDAELVLDDRLVYRLTLRSEDMSLDGLVHELAEHPQVQALFVWDASTITAKELTALAALPHLRSLTLQGATRLDGAAIAALAGAPALERLRVSGAPLTDRDLATLAGAPRLRHLSLLGCDQLTGSGLGALAPLPIERLDLSWCTGLLAEDLAQLASWSALSELSLRGLTQLRGRDWSFLGRLEGLQRLDLSGCAGVDEDVFRDLGGLERLASLDVSAVPHEVQPLGEGVWLGHLADSVSLRELDLAYTELGVEGQSEALLALARLPALESLDLSSWELSELDHATLQAYPALRWITCSLRGESLQVEQPLLELSQVTAFRPYGSIEPFTESVPDLGAWVALTRLDLRSSDETGDGSLQVLKGLPQLEWLLLDAAQVTDQGLSALRACPRLQVLSLRRCDRLTPAAARVLATLTELEVLDLRDCPWVDDAVLQVLSQLGGLRSVLLRGTHVTREGTARLRQALPDCTVAAGSADAGG